ncbi:MAG: hypothetical protein NTV43_00640 [Methylococcales bacterium]|nr:hypothetical protein [Methylococcales bacterium]
MSNIEVGTIVRATFGSFNDDSLTEAFGKVIAVGRFIQGSMGFDTTVLWDDGCILSMTDLFFRQTVQVVDAVVA